MSTPRYDRRLLALDDNELEEFVRQWASRKQYHEVQRFTGTGDMGRDVVGFLTKDRHDGPWHNYQCKQYGKTLPTAKGMAELGKVLYYSHCGEFTRPTGFYFVAPRGVNRNLKRWISKPLELKQELIANWDKFCGTTISESQIVTLTSELRQWIEEWDFSLVRSIGIDEILSDSTATPVLYQWFAADPGPAPPGSVPLSVEPRELPYVTQLIDAYSERDACTYSDHEAISAHACHGTHFGIQRERFFDADAFIHHYRDNMYIEDITLLRTEIYHGIFETHGGNHADSLARVDAVMGQASTIAPSGVLGKYARVPVKQGLCHHFANEGKLTWKKY
jgi:hypothetical protein